MSCVEAPVERGRKRLDDGEVMADQSLSKVPVIFLDGESMPWLEAKWQVRQFVVGRYRGNHEECLGAAPEEAATTDVVAGDLDDEADWNLADLTCRPDVTS